MNNKELSLSLSLSLCSGASDKVGQQQQLALNQGLMEAAEFGHLHCIKVLVPTWWGAEQTFTSEIQKEQPHSSWLLRMDMQRL
jgi:hypothetical protein